jgi:hypothetical protein
LRCCGAISGAKIEWTVVAGIVGERGWDAEVVKEVPFAFYAALLLLLSLIRLIVNSILLISNRWSRVSMF